MAEHFEEKSSHIAGMRARIEELERELAEKDQEIKAIEADKHDLKTIVERKDGELRKKDAELDAAVKEKDATIAKEKVVEQLDVVSTTCTSAGMRTEELERELEKKIEELAEKDQKIKVIEQEKHDLEAVVEELRRKDTELGGKDTEGGGKDAVLGGKDVELRRKDVKSVGKGVELQRKDTDMKSEKRNYVITALLMMFLVIIVANRHIGLSSYQQSYAVCTQRVVELTERVEAYGQEQLKECQSQLMILKEVQGRFEESSTNSLTVIKQLEDSKEIYSKQADQAVKDKEKCTNQLNRIELEKYQYFQNMSLLDGDKRELNVKFMTCSDQLVKCAQEADELEAKLSHAAKEKYGFVHHLKNEEIRYHVLFRNNIACSEQLAMCNGQLDECKLMLKQETKRAEEFKVNVFIVIVVVVVLGMCVVFAVNVLCSGKQKPHATAVPPTTAVYVGASSRMF